MIKQLFLIILIGLVFINCDGSGTLKIRGETIPIIPQTDGLNLEDHRIFVSSTSSRGGDYGSLADADAVCANLAGLAGLVRDYKALMSDSTNPAITRLTFSGEIYNFSDSSTSILIADDIDLFAGAGLTLSNGIAFDENYVDRSGHFVWSGTNNDGTAHGNNCGDWSFNVTTGMRGIIGSTSATYINNISTTCSQTFRLYCVSQ